MSVKKLHPHAKAAGSSHTTPLLLIDEAVLDIDSETFARRLFSTGISTHQFEKMTDITRPRLKRVCDGETKSLVERTPGNFVVPRHFVIVLLAIEAGLLVKGEESL